MFSPFTADTAPNRQPAEVTAPLERKTDKITFRPPQLGDMQVVSDPFVRVGPRLRCLEYFLQEMSP